MRCASSSLNGADRPDIFPRDDHIIEANHVRGVFVQRSVTYDSSVRALALSDSLLRQLMPRQCPSNRPSIQNACSPSDCPGVRRIVPPAESRSTAASSSSVVQHGSLHQRAVEEAGFLETTRDGLGLGRPAKADDQNLQQCSHANQSFLMLPKVVRLDLARQRSLALCGCLRCPAGGTTRRNDRLVHSPPPSAYAPLEQSGRHDGQNRATD